MANISRVTDQLFTGGDLPLHLGSGAMLLHLGEMQDAAQAQRTSRSREIALRSWRGSTNTRSTSSASSAASGRARS